MQANEDVARKLAQLTVKAGEQRAQIQDELTYMRSKPASAVKNIGVDAVKTPQPPAIQSASRRFWISPLLCSLAGRRAPDGRSP